MDPPVKSRAFRVRKETRLRAASKEETGAETPWLGTPEPGLASATDIDLYLAHGFLPWRREGRRVLIATTNMDAENLAGIRVVYDRPRFAAILPAELHKALAGLFREQLSADAVFALASRSPRLSARTTITRKQSAIMIALGVALAALGCLAPEWSAEAFVGATAVGFVVSATARAALALYGSHGRDFAAARCGTPSRDEDLPVYTILVPVYREARVLSELANALMAFDYPHEKLDIKLVVEEDDLETRAVAENLAKCGPFEVVAVPFCLPRTKPKACNYALRFARGDYLVIYDAEDRPEPDQLRKAVAGFARASPDTACLQARLGINNAEDGWLAGLFALDYTIWFWALLPGLSRLGAPIPLGGTSNHFRTSILRHVAGWDPFNVTEDADLGIRLARLGYRVAMLDSTTFEEAPSRIAPWIKQRSRWLKGYMQTWLVHTRDPVGLADRIGVRGAAALQLFLGGAIWSALVNPVLWLIFAVSCIAANAGGAPQAVEMMARISGFGLFAANAMLAGLVLAGGRYPRRPVLALYGLGIVLYWFLISAAAYRGLWQLVFKPFYWEKTPHGRARPRDVLCS